MRNLFIPCVLLTLLTVTSCYKYNKEQASTPKNLLSQQQMIDILTEIQLAEGKVVLEREKNKNYRLTGKEYANEIYNQFGITPEQLIENLNYYQDQEDFMVDVFDEVLAHLSTMQDEVKVKIEEELLQIKTDSIHHADSVAKVLADSIIAIKATTIIADTSR